MNRRDARETMMKILYQMDVTDCSGRSFEDMTEGYKLDSQGAYCRDIFEAIKAHQKEIDDQIDSHSINWKIRRMPKTDIAALRLAATEILYMNDIPVPVSINEAVELAKKYGTDQSPGFVNAVLGSIVRDAIKEQ